MTPLAEAQVQQKLAHITRGQRLLNRRTRFAWHIVIVLILLAGLGSFLAWLSPVARDALIIGLIALSLLWSIELVLGTLTLWLLVELIKAFTDRARPFNLRRESRVIGRRLPGLSFPSGHTAQTFLIVALCISHFQLSLGIATGLYSIGALAAFTRIYVGAHYPRDVIAGAILGLVWGIVSGSVTLYFWAERPCERSISNERYHGCVFRIHFILHWTPRRRYGRVGNFLEQCHHRRRAHSRRRCSGALWCVLCQYGVES